MYLSRRNAENKSSETLSPQQKMKEEGKGKILQALRNSKGRKITNDDVEQLLRVSDATATRYLDELEEDGKITQVGKTGKGVHYTLK